MRNKNRKRHALSLCAGEKEERPTFYVRKRMEWERHIAELTTEGSEAFSVDVQNGIHGILETMYYPTCTCPS